MTTVLPIHTMEPEHAMPAHGESYDLYQGLYSNEPAASVLKASCAYLQESLKHAATLPCDLPDDWSGLDTWIDQRHETVGRQYLQYLSEREAGAPRRYFTNLSHALYFLQGVAPTKHVDGSWLYGLLPQWWDDRYRALVRIYLEELGEGSPADNHVAMYRRLLAVNGCEHVMPLSDEHYVQGALQLSLAHNAAHFLPEVVGFNLGYEQLPLHLLITTHELKELGVDAYYFQVHVTVDNAGTGHARKALESVRALCPSDGNERDYYARVRRGYNLNELGQGTVPVIDSFDLDAEMTRVLVKKAVHGRHMHSDYSKVAGRTVNDWLTHSEDVPQFLCELERCGWITRHCDPARSRLWRLIDGQGADMFGVFSAYEQQVIYDWIAGDWQDKSRVRKATMSTTEIDRRLPRRLAQPALGARDASLPTEAEGDFGVEIRDFEQQVMQAQSRDDLMARLAGLMGPASHHTPVGLAATRMFGRLMDMA